MFQPDFRHENLQLHYIDTDSFVLSINSGNIIENVQSPIELFDCSILNENHEFFSNKIEKVTGL